MPSHTHTPDLRSVLSTYTVMMNMSAADLRSELISGAGLKSKGCKEDATIKINRKLLCLRYGPLHPK